MPSLARSVPKPLKVPSLARSVQKPLKVPSLARSVLKPLKVPSLARSVQKPLKVPSLARSVPKPRVGQAIGFTFANTLALKFWQIMVIPQKIQNLCGDTIMVIQEVFKN